ncbi:hypothetical protein [Amaricoccus sp.]|uniref:hypothetical protein n=1 Tax=Amaricoccus sp. TaxID=1872485 RepID=UPI001B50789C|nr:hypothetical protein [Amaricoccus sp.]MBP7241444.1 hypothetical protein [Amaricoccus sp.]
MTEPRSRRGPIVFMAVWLVIWSAAILIVLWMLGGALLSGDLGLAPFLMIWLGVAGLGLWAGVRRLQRLMRILPEPGPRPTPDRHVWRDDLPPDGRAQSGQD